MYNLGQKLMAEFLGRTVRGLPWIVFERDDLVADEASRPLLQFDQLGGK